jgi:hypothetical protein
MISEGDLESRQNGSTRSRAQQMLLTPFSWMMNILETRNPAVSHQRHA